MAVLSCASEAAYQAAGVTPIDVREPGCDYLASGSLKYLLGLPGIAFLYVRGGLERQREPELTGWFGRRQPFAFGPRLLGFPDDARRFETGTPPIPSAYAANAGFDLIERIDLHDVRRHVSALVEELAERLAAEGARGPQVAIADEAPDGWPPRRPNAASGRHRAATCCACRSTTTTTAPTWTRPSKPSAPIGGADHPPNAYRKARAVDDPVTPDASGLQRRLTGAGSR
ncbi:aminotransferase class V-fold PLP-dependent enzyme [Nonomuraea sp. NPDC049309]|uniref:aminotransferase class V-fold PLP-dependent enzyme n=1 Tax=Nonomuraea sp. NPDC049309 TaxID=3364350 RepID=UPI00371AD914